MWVDLINATIAGVTLAVTVVIYRLGRRIGLRATMERRDAIAAELSTFSRRIYQEGHNRSILLMNTSRYSRGDYTAYQGHGQLSTSWRGELFVGGEFIGLQHDGFEVMTGAWSKKHPDAPEIQFVPFDRVEWVNLDGDENFNRVIVYVSFKGPYPSPHTYSYPANKKPFRARGEGRNYYRRIDGSKLTRTTGLQAWWQSPKLWVSAIQFGLDERRQHQRLSRLASR